MFAAALALLIGATPVATGTPALSVVAEAVQHATAIPPGAQRVPMLTVRVTNTGTETATVRSAQLYRTGPGDAAEIDGVYALLDGRRISGSTAVVARSGKVPLRFRPSVSVAPGATVVLDIRMDLSADASPASEHALAIRSPSDIGAGSASVNLRSVAAPATTRVGAPATGTVRVEYLPLTQRIRYGQNRLLLRMRLHADREDQVVRSITLTNNGSATASDVENIVIESSRAEILAGPVMLQNRTGAKPIAVFRFTDPPFIRRGSSITLNVRASVLGSVRHTIQLIVDEPSDVIADVFRAQRQR